MLYACCCCCGDVGFVGCGCGLCVVLVVVVVGLLRFRFFLQNFGSGKIRIMCRSTYRNVAVGYIAVDVGVRVGVGADFSITVDGIGELAINVGGVGGEFAIDVDGVGGELAISIGDVGGEFAVSVGDVGGEFAIGLWMGRAVGLVITNVLQKKVCWIIPILFVIRKAIEFGRRVIRFVWLRVLLWC